jgi:hypothetical protein
VSGNYFDAVIIGDRLGPLVCAGLLAKRGFRVLLVTGDAPPPSYELDGITLPRDPFTFLAADSPIARRVFSELALGQRFRRRARTVDPPFGVALPGHRFDVPSEQAPLEREIEREFPNVRRPIEEFFRHLREENDQLDAFFGRDLPWSPRGFLERRELSRAAAHLPFDEQGRGKSPLAELPQSHPFRMAVLAPVTLASHVDQQPPTELMVTRLFASWWREPAIVEGGWAQLSSMLMDKIRTLGGEVRERERSTRILTTRGAVTGVLLSGSDEPVGAGFVVCGHDLSRSLRLFEDRRAFERTFETKGEPQTRYYRYTLNLVLPKDAIPAGLARDTIYVRELEGQLWGENLLRIHRAPMSEGERGVLCVESLLPRRGVEEVTGYLDTARDRVLESLSELMPFLRESLSIVDSPHDGRPPTDGSGAAIEDAEPWGRGPRSMRAVHGYPLPGALGVSALPVRTPIKRFLWASHQVLPGLGTEGELLSAWAAARIVTRSDKRKNKMRRGLWTKVEI